MLANTPTPEPVSPSTELRCRCCERQHTNPQRPRGHRPAPGWRWLASQQSTILLSNRSFDCSFSSAGSYPKTYALLGCLPHLFCLPTSRSSSFAEPHRFNSFVWLLAESNFTSPTGPIRRAILSIAFAYLHVLASSSPTLTLSARSDTLVFASRLNTCLPTRRRPSTPGQPLLVKRRRASFPKTTPPSTAKG